MKRPPHEFRNKFVMRGKSQRWTYNGGCEYECECHKGKVEWHHPVRARRDVGIFLCELHHSLVQGRSTRKRLETAVNKTLDEMRSEIHALVLVRLKDKNLTEANIDKH